MKKIFFIGISFIILFIVGILGVASTKPDTFHIERSYTVKAPRDKVFVEINTLKEWETWSPWQKMDPEMKQSYEGPESGIGAAQTWKGNDKVGEGKMTITESVPSEKVAMQLEFYKPFESTSSSAFTLKEEPEGTLVTWSMDGHNNLMGKVMCMFMDMDKMVGKDFENGLKGLEQAVLAKGNS